MDGERRCSEATFLLAVPRLQVFAPGSANRWADVEQEWDDLANDCRKCSVFAADYYLKRRVGGARPDPYLPHQRGITSQIDEAREHHVARVDLKRFSAAAGP
jgi:hypothetical protein